jgi:hypothetical protein
MRRLPALRSLRIHADRGSLSRLGLLKHLEELEVTGRAAQTLRPALGLLPRLRRLSVHWDQLRRTGEPQEIVPLPTTIRAMKQLRRLDLTWYPADAGAGLQCGELPEWLAELPLAELQLWAPGQGGLRRLPAAVYRLVGLRRLVVALATDEHGLEPAIARLGALEHLVLRTSGYGRLPADIRLPTALTLLETSFMPANLSELSRLRTLRLHRLPLGKDDVAAIARLPALEQLDARCAPGVALPPALAGHADSKRGRRC